jgi:hypothetical protein
MKPAGNGLAKPFLDDFGFHGGVVLEPVPGDEVEVVGGQLERARARSDWIRRVDFVGSMPTAK